MSFHPVLSGACGSGSPDARCCLPTVRPVAGSRCRRLLLSLVVTFAAAATLAAGATAQEVPADPAQLPAEVLADVDAVFNAPLTRRIIGPLTIGADQIVATDLAVLDGPLEIRGRVMGSVLAVNAPVRLEPGAVIEGSLLVVGGSLEQVGDARVAGRVRIHSTRLNVRWDGSRLSVPRVATDSTAAPADLVPAWWERMRGGPTAGSGFTVTSGGTYNRVEGLAVAAGPRIRRTARGALITGEALGIARTAQDFRWDSDNLGHLVTVRADFPGASRFSVGGRLHDIVAPVERWALTDTEVGLAALFGQRDFRDHYSRHGGEVFANARFGDLEASLKYADERWGARDKRSVMTLFRGSRGWRDNPRLDAGSVRITELSMRMDTRNNPADPWKGWHLKLDYEFGSGRLSRELVVPGVADALNGSSEWGRLMLDARHYARISPSAQLNFRFVAGGWLHGDELPLQRRLSLGGPGTLPGYDFRTAAGSGDPLACGAPDVPGRPALCDRIILVQMDYKGDIPAPRVRSLESYGWPNELQWVVFADAGRGWLVNRGPDYLREPSSGMPDVGSWLADVGVGLEMGPLGVYVARGVSTAPNGLNLFVRLGQRF